MQKKIIIKMFYILKFINPIGEPKNWLKIFIDYDVSSEF